MKIKNWLPVVFVAVSGFVNAQELVEKEKLIDVLQKEEVLTRKRSIGAFGGAVMYFGEQSGKTTLDYGISLTNYLNNRYEVNFNAHYGEMRYTNIADIENVTSYKGFNALFKVNLIETFTKSDEIIKVSPYVAAGMGAFLSNADHYRTKGYFDFYLPLSIGVNFNVSERFIVGVNATGRMLFSDVWDNSTTTSSNDMLFNPSVGLKYVFARKKTIKRRLVQKVIKYRDNEEKANKYGTYIEKSKYAQGYVIEIKDTTRFEDFENEPDVELEHGPSKLVNNTKNNDFIFYTIQIGSLPSDGAIIEGIDHDFEFYNEEIDKYNYCVGFFSTIKEANTTLKITKNEVKSSFVIAIHKDKRYRASSANRMIKKGTVQVNADAAKTVYSKK